MVKNNKNKKKYVGLGTSLENCFVLSTPSVLLSRRNSLNRGGGGGGGGAKAYYSLNFTLHGITYHHVR